MEADRLGLQYQDIYPTFKGEGGVMYNYMIRMYMGPLVEKNLGAIISSPDYLKLNDGIKSTIFKELLGSFKKTGAGLNLMKLTPERIVDQLTGSYEKKQLDALRKYDIVPNIEQEEPEPTEQWKNFP